MIGNSSYLRFSIIFDYMVAGQMALGLPPVQLSLPPEAFRTSSSLHEKYNAQDFIDMISRVVGPYLSESCIELNYSDPGYELTIKGPTNKIFCKLEADVNLEHTGEIEPDFNSKIRYTNSDGSLIVCYHLDFILNYENYDIDEIQRWVDRFGIPKALVDASEKIE